MTQADEASSGSSLEGVDTRDDVDMEQAPLEQESGSDRATGSQQVIETGSSQLRLLNRLREGIGGRSLQFFSTAATRQEPEYVFPFDTYVRCAYAN